VVLLRCLSFYLKCLSWFVLVFGRGCPSSVFGSIYSLFNYVVPLSVLLVDEQVVCILWSHMGKFIYQFPLASCIAFQLLLVGCYCRLLV